MPKLINVFLTNLIILLVCFIPSLTHSQSIGFKLVDYVPNSENQLSVVLPITPAIESFSKELSVDLKAELKQLKRRDKQYELKKKDILKKKSIEVESALRTIFEIESLRVWSEYETLTAIYNFLDCWSDKHFRSSKKNFCKGCWEAHIERERIYKQRVATVYE